ncbi:uncharacterized protein TA13920 [Theileria annulata]|nr:uncharacterized protein TA13920 [Theileria annulata]CAI74412.1 hypothetical protein TA13920 [Theileria annulata]|eukprot:XP_952144.1 hypothetical protein TA13920 [Theileria annulata]
MKITSGYGASAILILDGTIEAFSTNQVTLHRQILLSTGIGGRIVWCNEIEQIDPCECKCLYSKGISLSFFNPKSIFNTNSYQGIIQHSILLFLKHINTLYLSN